jgi:salicylate hydroxylase
VLEVYGYDVEAHAETALEKYLNGGREVLDADTGIAKSLQAKYMNWFRPSRVRKQSMSKL